MNLPKQYEWIAKEAGPKMILNAMELFDTTEVSGVADNKEIVAWAKEVGQGLENIYKSDSIPWCGLFIAVVAKRSDKEVVKDPLWALNWGTFGKNTDTPMFGDVLVFVRKTTNGKKAGHVGLYVGEDAKCYHVLGGNQSDKVCFTRIEKSRLYACRRPIYKNQPTNVRVIKLSDTGIVSKNEQ